MSRIELTPEAINDLESIKEYLIQTFGEKKEKEILKKIFRRLSGNPRQFNCRVVHDSDLCACRCWIRLMRRQWMLNRCAGW